MDLNPKDKRIKAQRAKYKKFVESGLGFNELDNAHNRLKMVRKEGKNKENQVFAKKFFLGKVREE